MSSNHLQRLARGRMRYTGETYNQARSAVDQLRDGGVTIPEAHNDSQRQLECVVMSALLRGGILPIRAVRPFTDGLEVLFEKNTVDNLCISLFRDLLRYGIVGGLSFTAKGGSAGVQILGEKAPVRLLLRKVSWARFQAVHDEGIPGGPVPAVADLELSGLLRRAAVLKTAEDLAWAADRQHHPIPAEIGALLANPIHGLPSFQAADRARPDRPPAGRKIYALLVGINQGGLTGCQNDVGAVRSFLQSRYSDADLMTSVLLDGEATRERIIAELSGHLAQAGPRDSALFWLSGHGISARLTASQSSIAGIVTAGHSREDPQFLQGSELVRLLNNVAERAGHVVAVIDACHAEGAIGGEPLIPVPDHAFHLSPTGPLPAPPTEAAEPVRFVGLAATTAQSLAFEYESQNGIRHGIFTEQLLIAMKRQGPDATYRELATVLHDVQLIMPTQHPVLRPGDPGLIDQPFLGGRVRRPVTGITMRHIAGTWVIDAGSCHGLMPNTTLAVAGTNALRQVTVTELRPGTALVQPVGWEPKHDTMFQLELAANVMPATEIAVEGENETAARIREAIGIAGPGRGPSPYLTLAAEADLRVVVAANRVRIHHGVAKRPLADLAVGPRTVTQTVRILGRVARWQQLLYLNNPVGELSNRVFLEIIHQDEPVRPDADGVVRLGYYRSAAPKVHYRLHNTSSYRLYCALITLTDTFGAHTSLLHGAWIAPGSVGIAAYGRSVDLAPAPGPLLRRGDCFSTWIKLVIATQPFSVTRYDLPRRLEERRSSRARITSPVNPPITGTLMGSRDHGPTRRSLQDADAGWSTTTVHIEVRK